MRLPHIKTIFVLEFDLILIVSQKIIIKKKLKVIIFKISLNNTFISTFLRKRNQVNLSEILDTIDVISIFHL